MQRYLETFFRHRLLLIAPILITLFASLGLTMMHPRMYQASARVWFDSSTISGSTSWNPYTAPADAQAASMTELLQTRTFCRQVGLRGPLASYLKTSAQAFSDPLSKLIAKISGTQPSGTWSDQMLTDQVVATITQGTTVTPVGPQILSVTFSAPNPTVAAGTAQAIVDEFFDETLANRQAEAQSAVDFYQKQLADMPAPAKTDTVAQQRYDDLAQKLDAARLQLAADQQPSASGFRIVDRAQVPDRPVGIRKALLLTGVEGLAIGMTISLLLLMLLTWSDRTIRRPEDFRTLMEQSPVGVIPRTHDRASA